MPLQLFERNGDGTRKVAYNHPLYKILHNQPNPEMSSVAFRLAMQTNLSLRREAFALIKRNGRGSVAELWPIEPHNIRICREASVNSIVYEVKKANGSMMKVPERDILRLTASTQNGLTALDPLKYSRDTIGLAIALQDNASKFFANGSRPGAILEHPQRLTKETGRRVVQSFERAYKGNKKAYRVAILEEGMKFVMTRQSNQESQMVEQRKFQDIAICQVFQIQPHKVGILDHATFSNIEFQGIEYVTDTILPQARIWEQELWRQCMTPAEQKRFYVEFNLDGLMRGDIQTRYRAYAVARNWGWLNVDEIRRFENMNPLPNGAGEIYLQPLNMQEAGLPQGSDSNGAPAAAPEEKEDPPENETDEEREKREEEEKDFANRLLERSGINNRNRLNGANGQTKIPQF